jgi:hypothetical protein
MAARLPLPGGELSKRAALAEGGGQPTLVDTGAVR